MEDADDGTEQLSPPVDGGVEACLKNAGKCVITNVPTVESMDNSSEELNLDNSEVRPVASNRLNGDCVEEDCVDDDKESCLDEPSDDVLSERTPLDLDKPGNSFVPETKLDIPESGIEVQDRLLEIPALLDVIGSSDRVSTQDTDNVLVVPEPNLQPELNPEPDPELSPEPRPRPELEPEPEPQPEPKPRPEFEPEPEPRPEQLEPEPLPEPKPQPEPEFEPESEPEPEQLELESEPRYEQLEPEPLPKPQPQPELEPEPEPQLEPVPVPEPKPQFEQLEPEPVPEPQPEQLEPVPVPELKPQLEQLEPEPEPVPEPNPQLEQLEPELEPEPQLKLEPVPEPEPEQLEPKPVPEPEPEQLEPKPVPEPKHQPESEPELLEPELSPEPKLQPESEPELSPEPKLQPEYEPELSPEPKLQPESEPEPSPEPKLQPELLEPEPSPEPKPQPESEPQPEPEPQLEPEPEPQLEPELEPEPEPEPEHQPEQLEPEPEPQPKQIEPEPQLEQIEPEPQLEPEAQPEPKPQPEQLETRPEQLEPQPEPKPQPEQLEPQPSKTDSVSVQNEEKTNTNEDKEANCQSKVLDRETKKTDEVEKEKVPGEQKSVEKYPIKYKGFKKKHTESDVSRVEKRISLRGNPFNPACKKDSKSSKYSSKSAKGKDVDSCTLQPEYAQYLGLQPIVKFRCSNCGTSSFQSMSALNTHQVDCKKSGKVQSSPIVLPQLNEPKSTNIKLTRKVFLCSACGTYYENWNLFLHMREVHRRYICLYCLGMFSIAEKLAEHLMQKHKVISQNFSSIDEFQQSSHPTYFLLCLSCDHVFCETDNFYSHTCTETKSVETNSNSSTSSKGPSDSSPNACKNTTPKASSPETKASLKPSNTNNKYTSGKRSRVDWSKAPSKTDYDEDYVCNVASFCKVDFGDTRLGAQGKRQSGETSHEARNEDKVEESAPSLDKHSETNTGAVAPADCNMDVDVKSSDTPDENVSRVKDVASPEEKEEIKVATVEKPEKRKGVKRSKPGPVKRQVKKKRMSTAGRFQKKQLKNENCENSLVNEPEPLQNSVTQSIDTTKMEDKIEDTVSENTEKKEMANDVGKNVFKIKLQSDMESDGESDDSQKLSLVVDENASVSDSDTRKLDDDLSSQHNNSNSSYDLPEQKCADDTDAKDDDMKDAPHDEIQLAGEEVAAMALTLDDKIDNVKIQSVVKECVRTSCQSCNYCRHAVKIAVNGKQLALHLLSEHRYTPVKNETCDDFVRRLKNGVEELETMFFNTEMYDSSDSSIHIPYDKDSNFDCFQCNYVTTSHRDLYAHKRKSHTKSLLLCIMCKSNFYSYSELLCHLCPGAYNAEIQFQNTDINFRCCFCRLDTIPSAFRLMVHLRKCHHTCDICLEICPDQQKLSTHMWKHKLNHLCYRCGIAYASKPDITKHLFWKHGTESVLCKKCLQKKWPHVYHFCIPPTSFICEECNTSFSKAVALKVHKRIHAGDFSYTCSHCEKKFISKKLLARHEERHKKLLEKAEAKSAAREISPENDQKEETINVTDVSNEIKDKSTDVLDSSKDHEVKDKSHKKHKKEKDKKSKPVVDVYDLPPLNLSSESDSSDDEQPKVKKEEEVKLEEGNHELPENGNNSPVSMTTDPQIDSLVPNEGEIIKDEVSLLNNVEKNDLEGSNENSHVESSNSSECKENNLPSLETIGDLKKEESETIEEEESVRKSSNTDELTPNNHIAGSSDDQDNNIANALGNEPIEDIWENFYKASSQTRNLPYPLCAMKSEIAYGIIMGDHDYCARADESRPVIKDDVPSTSNLDLIQTDEKIEPEDIPKPSSPLLLQEIPPVPPLSAKKKQKSPKKKNSKNNSSSSSDSSSDSDSSSCSCGTNCSCSSSSSNSSSSSSSDSDSSSTEGRQKQEKRRKRKDKRSKPKEETTESIKEPVHLEPQPEEEILLEPEDPPIRESELETDETSTDEEFYDRQPQRIANQLLAEKRNQLMLLASVAPVNNGTSSPTQIQESVVPEQPSPIKQKQKSRRREQRKKVQVRDRKAVNEKQVANSVYNYNESLSASTTKHLKQSESKLLSSLSQATVSDTAPGSGSETESTRSSKRRRIPNKFYGYSSGEEEEKHLAPPAKWRKHDLPIQSPKRQPLPPSTPRIQLTVPKQIIRKQFNHPPKPKSDSSSNDSDSGSDSDSLRENQTHSNQSQSQPDTPKTDVYCYCRCPYDEVSEMIACDDENCKIEWFHFECVGILVPPRGQWFCPECRKRRGLPT